MLLVKPLNDSTSNILKLIYTKEHGKVNKIFMLKYWNLQIKFNTNFLLVYEMQYIYFALALLNIHPPPKKKNNEELVNFLST